MGIVLKSPTMNRFWNGDSTKMPHNEQIFEVEWLFGMGKYQNAPKRVDFGMGEVLKCPSMSRFFEWGYN